MKRTGSGGKHSNSNGRKRRALARGRAQFVVCVKSKGYPESLEFGKIPKGWFIELRLPPAARRALASISA